MAISSVNNSSAFSVYANYSASSSKLQKSMSRLSTGVKSVVDDSAGVAMSEQMRSQARSTAIARNNVENGISVLQTADGWLQRVNDILSRMQELSIGASDGTKTTSDKANIQAEFQQMQQEIVRITSGDASDDSGAAAKFNGMVLFGGFFKNGINTQVGPDAGQTIKIELGDLTADNTTDLIDGTTSWADLLDDSVISVTGGTSVNVISTVQAAIDHVAEMRASIGAQQSRLDHTRTGLLTYEDNVRAAESKIRDVDMARESSEMVKYQILGQVGNAMLAQANQLPSEIVQLIG